MSKKNRKTPAVGPDRGACKAVKKRVYGRCHGARGVYVDDGGRPPAGWASNNREENQYTARSGKHAGSVAKRGTNGKLDVCRRSRGSTVPGFDDVNRAAESFVGRTPTSCGAATAPVAFGVTVVGSVSQVPVEEDVRCRVLHRAQDVVGGCEVELRIHVSKRGARVRFVGEIYFGPQNVKSGKKPRSRLDAGDLQRVPLEVDEALARKMIERLHQYVEEQGYSFSDERRYDQHVVATTEVADGQRTIAVDPRMVRGTR